MDAVDVHDVIYDVAHDRKHFFASVILLVVWNIKEERWHRLQHKKTTCLALVPAREEPVPQLRYRNQKCVGRTMIQE